MIVFPPTESSGRRLSEIDRFCILTEQTGKAEAARRVRLFTSSWVTICLALIVCLGLAVWRLKSAEQERDVLVQELRTERMARVEATSVAKDVEMSVASQALNTRVRADIVDERMLEQERRAAELERLAKSVEHQKLIEANCITPRSILVAAGL
jgi:hypothetical protein